MSDEYVDIYNLSDTDLWCLLVRTWNAISRLRELELAQFGLTVEQSSILKLIHYRGGSLTSKELEYLTMRQQHSISTLINRMLKGGLVVKEKEPDERRHKIHLTSKGIDLCTKVTTASVKIIFSSLSEEEKRQFSHYMRSIYNNTRDMLGMSYSRSYQQANEPDKLRIPSYKREENAILSEFELWTSLDITGFAVFRLRKLELAKLNLTSEQSMVLAVIDHNGGSTTAKELELFTTRQHHSISTLINRMVRSGLVLKEKSPYEKRHRIYMTEKGKNVFDRITTDSIEMVFSFLTNDKKAEFARILVSLNTGASRLLSVYQKQPVPQPVR